MIPMTIRFHADRLEPIFPDIDATTGGEGRLAEVVCVADGASNPETGQQRPTVVFRVELEDGRNIAAITTARLFCTMARAIMAKHPDLFEGE